MRAATPDEITAILPLAHGGPVHIHVAEQTREVDDCLAWSGKRPVELLLDRLPVDERWCLVHATHVTDAESAGKRSLRSASLDLLAGTGERAEIDRALRHYREATNMTDSIAALSILSRLRAELGSLDRTADREAFAMVNLVPASSRPAVIRGCSHELSGFASALRSQKDRAALDGRGNKE